jgi:hypothetical protein
MKRKTPIHKQTRAELLVTNEEWREVRMIRALEELAAWSLMPDGTLLHRTETDKAYYCDDVHRLEGIAGEPTAIWFTGCNCPDASPEGHLSRLNRAIETEGLTESVLPALCKHHWIRMLLAGHSLQVKNCIFRAKAHLMK